MTVCPDLRYAFPHTAEFVVNGRPTLHDVDFQPSCGYVSQEEAALLYTWARLFPGTWCEIGSHTGWSAAHIAMADNQVVAIEPQYVYLGFFSRARANWQRASVDERIYPVAALSSSYFEGCQEMFDGAFVDGDHEPGKPLEDARMLLPHLADQAVVLFHDCLGAPAMQAAEWLRDHQGFQLREYDTMAKLVACWRGDVEAPA